MNQLGKYRTALQKCLRAQFPDAPQAIECVVVLGTLPDDLDPEEVERTLAGVSASAVTYDSLIENALASYREYLEKHQEVSRIANLIQRLDRSGGGAFPEPVAVAGPGSS